MKSRLNQIKDWPELAAMSGYNARQLAKRCGVSVRQLERYFLKTTRQSPQRWLNKSRLHQAVNLLRDGSTVKETAYRLDYKYPTHLSRDFKQHFGISPSCYANRVPVLG